MAKYYGSKPNSKGGMISESKNSYANLPQEVKHVSYPKASYDCNGEYRDNLEGIDAFARETYSKVKPQIRKPSDA